MWSPQPQVRVNLLDVVLNDRVPHPQTVAAMRTELEAWVVQHPDTWKALYVLRDDFDERRGLDPDRIPGTSVARDIYPNLRVFNDIVDVYILYAIDHVAESSVDQLSRPEDIIDAAFDILLADAEAYALIERAQRIARASTLKGRRL